MMPQPWEAIVARPYDVALPPNYDEVITRCSRAHMTDIDAALTEAAPMFERADLRRALIAREVLEICFGRVVPVYELTDAEQKAFAAAWNAAVNNPLWRTGNN
jgi:hypothetical protein